MKRAILIVKGEVQRVGYRDVVAKIARKLSISGFVENLKPYDVKIVAEGSDTNIAQFIEQLKIKRFPIDVESVEVSFEPYKHEFEYFSRVSRSVKIINNPKGDTSSRLNVEEVNPNGYYRLSPNKNNV